SPASAALVIELPRIIPAIGMMYCGLYQGRTCTTTPITYASVAAVETVSASAAIHAAPGSGFLRRDTAAWVATPVMTPRIMRTQYQCAAAHTAVRMSPTA